MIRDGLEVMPLFVVRQAGVPYEALAALGTPRASALARTLVGLERDLDRAARAIVDGFPESPLDRAARQRLKRRLAQRAALPAEAERIADPALAAYAPLQRAFETTVAELDAVLRPELEAATTRLVEGALRYLPGFAVIASEEMGSHLERLRARPLDLGKSKDRNAAHHLALYMQRVCCKNDTISTYGPQAWGRIAPSEPLLSLVADPTIVRREVNLERWVVRAFLAAINADPDVRPELRPRRNLDGELAGQRFTFHDSGRVRELTADELAVLVACDGQTRAAELAAAPLAALVADGVVRHELEPIAMDARPMDTLLADVEGWREGPARTRWLAQLLPVVDLARRFAITTGAPQRAALTAQVRAAVQGLGGALPQRTRVLYQATNPISENCVTADQLIIAPALVETLMAGAEPWLQLFADCIALGQQRAYERLAEIHRTTPRRNGRTTLPAFLAHAAAQGVDLRAAGLIELGRKLFADMKRNFREAFADRPRDAAEWSVSADDLAFLRKAHAFRDSRVCTAPSMDVQLAAASVDAVNRGDYEWVISELHHGAVLLQNLHYSLCPDRDLVKQWMTRWTGGRTWALHSHVQFQGISVHTCSEPAMEGIAGARFLAPERPRPHWTTVAPSEAQVIVDEEAAEVRLVDGAGQDLGSLSRSFFLGLAFHPFFPLELAHHQPRLRAGRVVLQRESWHVRFDELGAPHASGISSELVRAVERLRAARGIPRWLFVRPSLKTLQAQSHLGRDKDAKPIFVDLESYLFIEIFENRLRKYGELELVEMLPNPEQLCWRAPDGHRVFEWRIITVPRGSDR